MPWTNHGQIEQPRYSWSAVLGATTTDPTGWTRDGVATFYQRHGKLIRARFYFTAGASATIGSGTWRIALPVTAASHQSDQAAGEAYYYDGGAYYAQAMISSAYIVFAEFDYGRLYWGSGRWASAVSGASIQGEVFYEAASF